MVGNAHPTLLVAKNKLHFEREAKIKVAIKKEFRNICNMLFIS
ncbi:hypothetical protein GM3709_951 [Geminocystis sp. NIES-3709]|nr:hypothetical protein GM3709_951 [Geminocystis sp. NIES-3709]